jgi:hypothetical protein
MTVCDVIVPTMLCTRQSIPHGRRASEQERENAECWLAAGRALFLHPRTLLVLLLLDQSKQTPLAFHLPRHTVPFILKEILLVAAFSLRTACRPEGIFCMI